MHMGKYSCVYFSVEHETVWLAKYIKQMQSNAKRSSSPERL